MDLFVKTPLIESIQMKRYVKSDKKVYLKLENCQPCASFKLRGISRLCQYALSKGYDHLVTCSGGNAGLALAYTAYKLGVRSSIVVPSIASQSVIETLKKYGANVEVFGQTSDDVLKRANELTRNDPKNYFVHPFDNNILWTGHSTIVDEIAEELKEEPALIITCCGGGGLICGIVEGMRRHNWTQVPVLAMETTGTASFNACVKCGGISVAIEKSSGLAVSLSPLRVCDRLLEYYNESKPPIISHVVEDNDAAESCLKFADDHRFLVEAACGAALSAVYKGLADNVIDQLEVKQKAIVVIVCGGAAIDIETIDRWNRLYCS